MASDFGSIETVKWFNVKSGYGFIKWSDTKEDVLVHQSAIVKNNPRKLGSSVRVGVVVGEKDNEATNVTGLAGEPVKRSLYTVDRRRGEYHKEGETSKTRGRDRRGGTCGGSRNSSRRGGGVGYGGNTVGWLRRGGSRRGRAVKSVWLVLGILFLVTLGKGCDVKTSCSVCNSVGCTFIVYADNRTACYDAIHAPGFFIKETIRDKLFCPDYEYELEVTDHADDESDYTWIYVVAISLFSIIFLVVCSLIIHFLCKRNRKYELMGDVENDLNAELEKAAK